MNTDSEHRDTSTGAPQPSATKRAGLADLIRAEALRLGFEAAGIAPIRKSDHADFYRAWIEAGRNGEMDYLARPDAIRKRIDPAAAWPELRSAIVVAHPYAQRQGEPSPGDPARPVLARYARGRDYHRVLKKKLIALLRWLEDRVAHPLPAARAWVDTGPVLERELAGRAGLGWFGRNTMLIHPGRGSYFFLGVLLVELDLEFDEPFQRDHCGSCTACIDACPTGALLGRDPDGAPVIDATRCISYLTIELRGPIPRELRPRIGNHVFGCDICQEVCPWNEGRGVRARAARAAKREGAGAERAAPAPESIGDLSLIELMMTDKQEWDRLSLGTAVRRARLEGFLRNVAVALGNWASPDAVPALAAALRHAAPLVRGHAAWALGRIRTDAARAALAEQIGVETDPWVCEELVEATGG